MLLLLTSLIFLLWQGAAAKLSNPVITAAPNPPTNEILGRRSIILEHERWLERKDAPSSLADGFDELGYCFGTGSICVESNALYSQCEPLEDENNDTKWFTCQCENDYFATDQECNWCQFGFNTSQTFLLEINQGWSSICSSISVIFAPVPASVLAIVSAWNATYTGIIPTGGGGGATATTGPSISASTSASISTPTSSGISRSAAATTASTLVGGGGVQTTAPPLVTHSGPQPSSTPQTSSGIECVQGWGRTISMALWGSTAWFLL